MNKSFDSGDATVVIMGVIEDEWTRMEYATTQEHQLNHSGSNKATSWSSGKVEHTATLEMYMSAVRKYEKAAKDAGSSLPALKPFPIAVTYLNDDQEEVTDIITAKFMSQGRTLNGEMGLKQSFELFVLDIQYSVS